MGLFLNIVILILETLYYSMFMKFSRREGKFPRYLLLFALFSIISLFLDKSFMLNYVLIFLVILYGLKYIVRISISLYDLLFIIIMFLIKIIIEIPFYYLFVLLLNGVTSTLLFQSIKVLLVYIFRNKLPIIYKQLNEKWKNNNFYIRYIFTILLFTYVIVSCLFLILR